MVLKLLNLFQQQATEIQPLKDRLARLNLYQTKPVVKPNTLETPTGVIT